MISTNLKHRANDLVIECHVYNDGGRLFVAQYVCNKRGDVIEYKLINMQTKTLFHYHFAILYDNYDNWKEVLIDAGDN